MTPQAKAHPDRYRLEVSRYDRASSMLIALLILLGLVVLVLFVAWLTNQIFLQQAAVPVELVELGTGDDPTAGGREIEGPPDQPVGPQNEPTVEETLTAVVETVEDQADLLDEPTPTAPAKAGKGGGSRGGGGTGTGRGRGTGMARYWEVRFIKGNTLETYARQLDFFRIELGVLLPDNKVMYVSNLAQPSPVVRSGAADQEKRYYLTWRGGELQEADRELLARAGVETAGRIILKFLPPDVEAQLAALEKAHAGADAKGIRRTRFGIRAEGEGYGFLVMEQSYR